MRRRTRTFAALLGFAAVAGMIGAASASATFHEIKIRSIFRSPSPAGAFIELQMYAGGQTLVSGHQLKIFTGDGTNFSGFTLSSNVANGQNQSRILIGDTSAPGSPDFTAAGMGTTLSNLAAAGAACWDTVDCVSWGNFTGEAHLPSPSGTPMAGSLSGTMVSVRNITANCSTALDAADDTDNSAADFGTAVGYAPRNNTLAPIETLCPTSTTPPPPPPSSSNKKKKKCKKAKKRAVAAKKCKKRK